ncbi:hypothetical protein HPB50_016821 [Hyalomma asiaticum]|uniref:Uncharacterized protein n=1 Tax=Hyalomma asiaticum TaxID=266040 RepID=A0ACB7TLC9_HYAAI|nr:hypothetical protein HPB50_016821 [Hyalomma asiaticum]
MHPQTYPTHKVCCRRETADHTHTLWDCITKHPEEARSSDQQLWGHPIGHRDRFSSMIRSQDHKHQVLAVQYAHDRGMIGPTWE